MHELDSTRREACIRAADTKAPTPMMMTSTVPLRPPDAPTDTAVKPGNPGNLGAKRRLPMASCFNVSLQIPVRSDGRGQFARPSLRRALLLRPCSNLFFTFV